MAVRPPSDYIAYGGGYQVMSYVCKNPVNVDGTYDDDKLEAILDKMKEGVNKYTEEVACYLRYSNEARRDYIVNTVETVYGSLPNILTTISVEDTGYSHGKFDSKTHNAMSYKERLAYTDATRTKSGNITVKMTWFD